MEQVIKQFSELFQGKLEGKILSTKVEENGENKLLVEQTIQFVVDRSKGIEYYREFLVALKNVCEQAVEEIDKLNEQ